jgi:hypothetical protein
LVAAERRSQQRLREGLGRVRQELTTGLAQEHSERLAQAARMQQEYQDLIAQERAERQQQINEVQGRVGRIEEREAGAARLAREWLDDLATLRAEVAKLPHQRFAPGRLERINTVISQGETNLQRGLAQAALVNAQSAYLDLVELRAETLYQEQRFEAAYLGALAEIRGLIAETQAHGQANLSAEGEESIEADVNFWSRGQLAQVQTELETLEQRLAQDKDTLTTEQAESVGQQAATLRARLPAAVNAARVAIINSQACYNVAQIVAEVLEEQGFEVDEGVYEGEDQRGRYAVKMRNRGGDEVVTIITPSADEELAYHTEMNFYDRAQDEALRQHFAQAVYQNLNQAGLQATPPRTASDITQINEAARDLTRFRQPQTETLAAPSAPAT